jgi:two-component system OmpR family response regulator
VTAELPPGSILLVDDDPHIAEVVEYALKAKGYRVDRATNGEEALELYKREREDLVILDINLPGRDGLWVCKALREFSPVPVLFLSARDEEVDRVMGLTIGGDDYVTKPFSPRELVARVEAILRRTPGLRGQRGPKEAGGPEEEAKSPKEAGETGQNSIGLGELRLDLESFEAFWQGRLVDLTAMEFKLLKTLCQRPRKVFSREELLNIVSPEVSVSDRTVDSHILHIRKKFQKEGAKEIIATQHGLGYSLARLG